MRIGSLFSGAGGLDMAVEQVFGGEVIWQAEVDRAASSVLAHRFPGVPNLGDITAVGWADVEPVDILCGGFPCQDVSSAGKRAGIKDGTRSGLWAIFADAIDQLGPPLVVIENVRGLLSARAHRNLEPANPTVGDGSDGPVLRAAGAVLGDLADLGYDAQWATVAAADVGAPHRRERVFILATDTTISTGTGMQQQDLSALQQRRGDRRPGQSGMCDCGDSACVADAPDSPRNRRHEGRPESTGTVGGFDAAVCGDEPGVALLPTPTAQCAKHGAESRFGGGNGDESNLWQIAHLLPTPVSQDGKDTHSSQGMAEKSKLTGIAHLLPTPASADGQRGQDFARANREGSGGDDLVTLAVKADRDSAWGKYDPAIRRWEQIAGPVPAPTEPNKNGNPRLSAAFSEWMMGWPAGWVTDPDIGIIRNDQLKIVGNGVCPQQAVAALRYLLTVAEAAS